MRAKLADVVKVFLEFIVSLILGRIRKTPSPTLG